ncbi:MAG: hypothetical protein AAGH15_05560 [Myxococcota bacterium]
MRALALLFALALLSACGGSGDGTNVVICGSPGNFDRVQLFSAGVDGRRDFESLVVAPDGGTALPLVRAIERRTGPGFIGVELFERGLVVQSFQRRLETRDVDTVELVLASGCRMVSCDVDDTCTGVQTCGTPPTLTGEPRCP